jgi:hypothetical protein
MNIIKSFSEKSSGNSRVPKSIGTLKPNVLR